ncbi:deoxyribose-phosphate aldolase [Putridiphycobacter roseus]|nr:deoxyribose-phosphate aldolase [Putridiphycobacter roseus]
MENATSLIPFIDLTSLNTQDDYTSITALIQKANKGFHKLYPAAVCTYPKYTHQLEALRPEIKKCVVSTYFPSSQAPLQLKLQEIDFLNQTNIDEIDIVLSVGEFLSGNHLEVSQELLAIRKKTTKTIKLILETGILDSKKNIQLAAQIGMDTGMDFLKTSTGKTPIGATINAVSYLAETISKTQSKTIGLKIAGGIRTPQQAISFITAIEKYLGPAFTHPATFRIGASSLYDTLIHPNND